MLYQLKWQKFEVLLYPYLPEKLACVVAGQLELDQSGPSFLDQRHLENSAEGISQNLFVFDSPASEVAVKEGGLKLLLMQENPVVKLTMRDKRRQVEPDLESFSRNGLTSARLVLIKVVQKYKQDFSVSENDLMTEEPMVLNVELCLLQIHNMILDLASTA